MFQLGLAFPSRANRGMLLGIDHFDRTSNRRVIGADTSLMLA